MKLKPNSAAFPPALISHWEKSDGINFAIALARITGWMLQVDWLTGSQETTENEMIPVRVYVETNQDVVLILRGKKGIMAFNQYVIRRVAHPGLGRIRLIYQPVVIRKRTLLEMPLRVKANEAEIERATKAIFANPSFLALIPKRQNPEIPAYLASKFSHGNCIPFAQALSELTGLQAMGISVSRYHPDCGNKLGFCHVVILHPDGSVEDSWGKQSLQQVLDRFYILEYTMNRDIYLLHQTRQKFESAQYYEDAYILAKSLLKEKADN